MKYLACSETQTVHAATLREYISANGLHRRCGIRKCRRDGQCTGPIYGVSRATSELFLIAREEIEADSHIGALPVCAMSLNKEEISAISEYLDGRRAQVERQPGLTVISPDRTIAARAWSSFAGIMPMPASEQPPLTPLARVGAGSSETA
jgi:hypothetical protein